MSGHFGFVRDIARSFAFVALASCGSVAPLDGEPADDLDVTVPAASSRAAPASRALSELLALEGDSLREALHEEVSGHTQLGYRRARRILFGIGGTVGLFGSDIACVYTGRTVHADATATPDGFDIEHSWPQSAGSGSEPARSDLHHLFASDRTANNRRNSYRFGETDCDSGPIACAWSSSGSSLGVEHGGTQRVFEVRNETRGDIARAQFYFAVRYDRAIPSDTEQALRTWHEADPPDGHERTRNAEIEAYQHNRNPFVDHPELVSHILDF